MNWKEIDLATWRLLLTAGLFLALAAGCTQQEPASETSALPGNGASDVVLSEPETLPAVSSSEPPAIAGEAVAGTEDGIVGQARDMLGRAADSGSESARQAGNWVRERVNGAASSTQQIAGDSWQWADETYQRLKAQGLTTATSTSEWLVEDWNSMEAWEYRVKVVEELSDEQLEAALNEWGAQGWECFDVQGSRMLFKKRRESYLRRLPFGDLIRLAPLMKADSQ